MSLKNKEYVDDDIAVYVMTHGPTCTWLDDYCIPMELGAELRNNMQYQLKDNDGSDSISIKNKLYNELTGLYWMWKYDTHKYVGLYHYRRVFPRISKSDIPTLLIKYDFIVPKPMIFKQSIERQYCHCHYKVDWDIMMDELKSLYPEYYDSAIKIFSEKRFIPCNMFVSTNENQNKYCAWLFPLLNNIEKRLNLSDGRSEYNKRVIAFMGERLFTLYLFHNKFNLKYVQVSRVPPHFPIRPICPEPIANIFYSNIHIYNIIINIQSIVGKIIHSRKMI